MALHDERTLNLQTMTDVTAKMNLMKLETEHERMNWNKEKNMRQYIISILLTKPRIKL